jgi:hypothetical protein
MKVSSFQPMDIYETQVRQAPTVPQRAPDPERTAAQRSQLASESGSADVISHQEKQYFAKLYPNDSQAITSYSTYSKNGVTQEYSVGSLIDKKS